MFGHWNASFRGVPFFVETEQETGKRRVAVHEFPMRDDPFLEDLGEGPRTYDVTAYVADDSGQAAAVQARVAAVLAACAADGPAILVLPLGGPRLARCVSFKRDFERDKMGFAAITANFIREGSSSGLVSLAQLGNAVFVAVDTLVAAAGDLFAAGVAVIGLPGAIASDAAAAFEDLVAGVEAIRGASVLDATVAADARDQLAGLYQGAGSLISRSTGAAPEAITGLAEAARAISGGMVAGAAVAAFGALAQGPLATVPAVTMTPGAAARAGNAVTIARVGRLVALAAYADALVHETFASRPEGVTARAQAAELFAAAIAEAATGRDEAVVVAVQDLAGQVADYLSRTISTLAPVVAVTGPRPMPALWWAWRLYADPARAAELVARNKIKHPAWMPERFEALAS